MVAVYVRVHLYTMDLLHVFTHCVLYTRKREEILYHQKWQPKSQYGECLLEILFVERYISTSQTVSATVGISLNYVIISKAWNDNQNKNVKTISDVELYTCL